MSGVVHTGSEQHGETLKMILIFDTSNNLVMTSNVVPSSHEGDEYTKIEYEEVYDPTYSYSLVGGAVVKGDLIPVDLEEAARLEAQWAIENAKVVAKQYLKDTDWYVTRKAEAGTTIPANVLTKRTQARIDASS